jgi:MFS family permease
MGPTAGAGRGKWLALTAALLGWMFDGFEMGLFPLVARPALATLLGLSPTQIDDDAVGFWNALITSSFLVGAASGGVLFGWLGDRLGRVRAMTLSILTYAVCSGLGGLAAAPWQMAALRFVAALGMGGEWSLGVALVMEVWEGRSRALLAGLIGAVGNLGYLLVGLLSLGLGTMQTRFAAWGLPADWVEWRLLMVCGALPALLTFFVRLGVPESESWRREEKRGATASWAGRDLLAVLAGVGVCLALLAVWPLVRHPALRLAAMLVALVLVAGCFLHPIRAYLRRSGESPQGRAVILRRMLLAALLSGIPLLATWGAVQWAAPWAHQLGSQAVKAGLHTPAEVRHWKEYTAMSMAFGAVVGCVGGALFAGWGGRRLAYVLLCASSLAAVLFFYQGSPTFGPAFLGRAVLAGGLSAAFYGWLPLYLPELFPTRVRATGQGFGFNFGRIIAAIGVLQIPVMLGKPPDYDYAHACSLLAFIYVLGLVVIWLAPETRGKPLPE